VLVNATRLRARGLRELREVLSLSRQVQAQLATSPGFLGGRLLVDRRLCAWTVTTWSDPACLRAFGRAHAEVATQGGRLVTELGTTTWREPDAAPPDWDAVSAHLPTVPQPALGLPLSLPPSGVPAPAPVP